MDKILDLIPKNVLAFLAIALGILLIVWLKPPYTMCDSQIELVKELQKRFLYKDPKSRKIETTRYIILRDQCRRTSDPGGCYELFQELKVMLHDLGTLTSTCAADVGAVAEFQAAVSESLKLMIVLAWGEAPPASYSAKLRWLDVADLSLFCQLKDRYSIFYGQSAFESFREKMMRELPGAENLPRSQVWDLSIFSENCAKYPN